MTHGWASLARLGQDLGGLRRSLGASDFLRYLGYLVVRAPRVVRSGSLVPVDQGFSGRSVEFRSGGLSVRLPAGSFSNGREMYARNVYLSHPRCQLPQRGWVLDLGANQGLFSVLAAKAGARVIAVEAQAALVPSIENLRRTNDLPEGAVTVVQALVGASTGLFATPGAAQDGTTIEALAEMHAVDEFAFVKMDIEGSEFALITPEAPWLDRVRCLAGEVHSEFGNPDALIQILESRGFQVARSDVGLKPIPEYRHQDGYFYAWRM